MQSKPQFNYLKNIELDKSQKFKIIWKVIILNLGIESNFKEN